MAKKKVITGASLIEEERSNQIKKKFDVKYDSKMNKKGQLSEAIIKLVDKSAAAKQKAPYMWDKNRWAKIMKKTDKEKLIVAGALIAAKLDMILAEEE